MENSWELNKSATNGRISYLISYLENENLMKSMLGIKGPSFDFTTLSAEVKTSYLYRLTKFVHYGKPNTKSNDYFYSKHSLSFTVIMHVLNTSVLRFTDRVKKLFIPKFHHDRKDTNFLKNLNYVGEKKETDEINFSEVRLLGRKLYEYSLGKNLRVQNFHPRELYRPFPDKWYQSIGFIIHGFSFEFKNAPNSIKNILNPNDGLINVENGTENADNNLTAELFFPSEKSIKEKIAEYNAIPTKNYINESYFLYDKRNLIK